MVRGWWSASNIILLWSRVGGQVCYRSLEGPFRNAFGNSEHNPCLPQNGPTKSLQNGKAQPLHCQEFSLQNSFGANDPLKKRQALQNGSCQPHFQTPKFNEMFGL